MAKLKLLIAHPDTEWLEKAQAYFQERMYDVDIVSTGKAVQIKFSENEYFNVMIDIELQNHPAIQVIKFIRMKNNNQYTSLMASNLEQLTERGLTKEQLKKFGASDVIFSEKRDLNTIAEYLEGNQSLGDWMARIPKKKGASEEMEISGDDEDFTPIRIDELFAGKNAIFDIYVKLSSGRYIKILHAGDQFDHDRINHYKNEKNVEFLYFSNRDRKKYVQFTNHLIKSVIPNEKVGAQTKVKMMKNVSQKFLEEVSTEGLKPQIIEQGKEICENLYNYIEEDDDLHKIMREYQDFDPQGYSHSFIVTFFASAIIKQFEWQSKKTIETTALASLMHDIGKMKLRPDVMELHPSQMATEQLELYQLHPQYGAEILDGKHAINNSVKQIIIQHHEHFDGSGFPNKLKSSKISTLSNIVCLANDFAHLIKDEEMKPTEALKYMIAKMEYVKRYNSEIVLNFIKIFVDPGKIRKENALPSNSKIVKSRSSSF